MGMKACPTKPSVSCSKAQPASHLAPFWHTGITLDLIGDANDYAGKGLSGGRVMVNPSLEFRGDAARNI